MTIQFTGLGSGMDYSSWIDALVAVKEESLTNIQTKIEKTEIEQTAIKNLRSEVSSLNSAITKFTDSNLLSAFDIFNRKKVSSSDEGKTASASVTNDATIQNFSLEVLQLATATVATGTKGLGKLADFGKTNVTNEDTYLKDIFNNAVTNGKVTITVNGEEKEFEVTDSTKLKDFKDFLTSSIGGVPNLENGILSLSLEQESLSAPNIVIGKDSDTSNLLDLFGISVNQEEDESNPGMTITTVSSDTLYIDNSSKLSDLNNGVITKGEIAIYVNNEKKVFTVNENTRLNDFRDFLLSEGQYKDTGVGLESVTLSENGNLSFTAKEGQDIKIGSTSDTSNLLDFFGFKNVEGTQIYSSDKILTEIKTTGKIMSTGNLAEHVEPSKFRIGTEEFTVDSNTSISGLIYNINSNSDSGVTASYDAVSNRLVLKAKDPGATTINIESIEGNFSDVVGWTNNGSLANGSQVLGLNSKFKINDQEFIAASNAISEDVTGIAGLTLSLNKTSNGDPTQINITNDYTDVESAIDTFVEKYNKLITDIKTASSKDGDLAYDSGLRRMASELSNTIMNIVPGLDKYTCLSTVGISTGGARTDVSDVSQELVFDKSKFEEAMTKNPNEVKKLFVNLDEDNRSNNGVMTKLKDIVEGYTDKAGEWHPGYLDYNSGYFAIKSDSCSKQIETLNESLTRKQLLIEQYRARLEKQFQSMDNYVSKMSSYSNYLSSIGTNAAAQ
ncbi:MAG: flagellar filament capping protein FliD [Candidatus Gastranaerophilales bacterium]|nr:flagellar filament capping protein FliD [Candidatus Gastranaerophilales bacterium]